MFKKKILGLLVILSMILSLGTSFVSAESTAPLTLTLGDLTCHQGEYTNVDLSIKNVPTNGISAFVLNVAYDKTKLEYVGMKATPVVNDMQNDISIAKTETGLKIMYADDAQTGNSQIKHAGVLCYIKFKAIGETGNVPLTLSRQNLKNYDYTDSLKDAALVNGSVEIIELELFGDANNDKVVDSADYSLLRKYLLGKYSPDYRFAKRMDVNGDTEVDSADYLILRSYLLKKISVFPVGVSVYTEGDIQISGTIKVVTTNECWCQITTENGILSLAGNAAGLEAYEGKTVTLSGAVQNRIDEVSGATVFCVR